MACIARSKLAKPQRMSSRQEPTWSPTLHSAPPIPGFYPLHQHAYTSPYGHNAMSTSHFQPSNPTTPQYQDLAPMSFVNDLQNPRFPQFNQGPGTPWVCPPTRSRFDMPQCPPLSPPLQTPQNFTPAQNHSNTLYNAQAQYPPFSTTSVHDTVPMQHLLHGPPSLPHTGYSRGPTFLPTNQYAQVPRYGGQNPSQLSDAGAYGRARTASLHQRRQSQQDTHNRNFSSSDHRGPLGANITGRRSDRSISPRTSAARRGYERFYHGSSQVTTSFDAGVGGARLPPVSRIRQRQQRPRGYFGHFVSGPNEVSCRQIEDMKAGLPRHLPVNLPEGKDPICDICQKDYSNEYVQSSNEQEIAVELPCGHCFGEFCLGHWVSRLRPW